MLPPGWPSPSIPYLTPNHCCPSRISLQTIASIPYLTPDNFQPIPCSSLVWRAGMRRQNRQRRRLSRISPQPSNRPTFPHLTPTVMPRPVFLSQSIPYLTPDDFQPIPCSLLLWNGRRRRRRRLALISPQSPSILYRLSRISPHTISQTACVSCITTHIPFSVDMVCNASDSLPVVFYPVSHTSQPIPTSVLLRCVLPLPFTLNDKLSTPDPGW